MSNRAFQLENLSNKTLNIDYLKGDDLQTTAHIYSVAQLSALLKNKIEEGFSNICVKGEISGLKIATSGHIYFNLKDADSIINCVCWRSVKLPVKLEDGLEVICTGSVTIYAARSSYQLTVKNIEVSGVGTLMALLEKRKKKFLSEGLFEQSRKKKIPFLPQTIGIITSCKGAVIRDMLHRISERFPVNIFIWDVPVQGNEAPVNIIQAIDGFNNWHECISTSKPDVLILARGGGSFEDLWAFNDEGVIYAISRSKIPIITAIGHETDTTLCDFVSDLRAPTPTAAAEFAVPVKADLYRYLDNKMQNATVIMEGYLKNNEYRLGLILQSLARYYNKLEKFENILEQYKTRLRTAVDSIIDTLNYKIESVTPQNIARSLIYNISVNEKELNYKIQTINYKFKNYLMNKINHLNYINQLLHSYSYKNTLNRGFAIVRNSSGENVIDDVNKLAKGTMIEIELKNGKRLAVIK